MSVSPRRPWHWLKSQPTHRRTAPEHESHSTHLVIRHTVDSCTYEQMHFVLVRPCLGMITAAGSQTKTRVKKQAWAKKKLWRRWRKRRENKKKKEDKAYINIYLLSGTNHKALYQGTVSPILPARRLSIKRWTTCSGLLPSQEAELPDTTSPLGSQQPSAPAAQPPQWGHP